MGWVSSEWQAVFHCNPLLLGCSHCPLSIYKGAVRGTRRYDSYPFDSFFIFECGPAKSFLLTFVIINSTSIHNIILLFLLCLLGLSSLHLCRLPLFSFLPLCLPTGQRLLFGRSSTLALLGHFACEKNIYIGKHVIDKYDKLTSTFAWYSMNHTCVVYLQV